MKRIAAAGVVLVALVLALPLLNLLAPATEIGLANRASEAESFAQAAPVLEHHCAACHAPGVKPPFYASLPVAGSLIHADIANGLAAFDMAATVEAGGEPTGEVTLAKIEQVVRDGSMPPLRYEALHWRSSLNRAQREAVTTWIQEVRVATYAPAGLEPEVQKRAVQPVTPYPGVDARKAALGRELYNDVRLSGDNSISCASCHDLAKGGTDHQVVSTGVGGAKGGINAPTVLNAAYQRAQFWDGRAATLEEQAAGPVTNPVEMASTWPQVMAKLKGDRDFTESFLAVYPEGLSDKSITNAIAEYERTLITVGSRFDSFLLGDHDALSVEEQRGWAVFQREGCQTCHVGKILGGQSFEKMGRERNYFADRGHLTEADFGRFNVTKDERDRYYFKVPTLRNVALTAPYFHDGSTTDLREAVRTMAVYQTDDDLSPAELDAVTALLRSMTGTLDGKPLQ